MRTLGEVQSLLKDARLRLSNLQDQYKSINRDLDFPATITEAIKRNDLQVAELRTQIELLQAQTATMSTRLNRERREADLATAADAITEAKESVRLLIDEHNAIVESRQFDSVHGDDMKKLIKLANKMPAEQLQELLSDLLKSGKAE